ncbi:hypothetical protein OsI_03920 [Oryza sativa Indica Group]|uniref:Uncharacterized protein n=1 Tax=Oryza sativa subsp. indica TaxID=39946 RepID=A2WVK1_ORYSI|nr:hypothetical protein OsI_03920 [Oryza sativa Indica Group]
MDTKGGVSHEMARATVQAHSFSERKKGSRRKHTCAAARVPYVFSGSAGKARAKSQLPNADQIESGQCQDKHAYRSTSPKRPRHQEGHKVHTARLRPTRQ